MDAAIGPVAAPAPQGRAERDRAEAAAPASKPEPAAGTRRSVELHEPTGSLVYRVIDVDTGAVVTQTPTDARLRLRAYIDAALANRGTGCGVEVVV